MSMISLNDMKWTVEGLVVLVAVGAAASACSTSYDVVLSAVPANLGTDAGTGGGMSVSADAGPEGGIDSGLPPCTPPDGAAVTLSQTGSGYVLSNGLVTATIGSNGQVTQVVVFGTRLMAAGQTMEITEPVQPAGAYAMNASSATVVRESAELVELSFVDTSGSPHDMDWDLHYVMRRGIGGLYYFLVAEVGTATHPNPVTLSQLGMKHSLDPSVFVQGYNGERHGLLPTPTQLSAATAIQDVTYLLATAPTTLTGVSSLVPGAGQGYDEGPVYTVYDWATYRTEDLVHGLYGNNFGAWILSPSWEYYTGGPLKQELTLETATLWNLYHSGHAGSGITTALPARWQKLFGPNLLYFNTGMDADVIADAQAHAGAEQKQWPYCWMNHPLYPLDSGRGQVTGTITEAYGNRWTEQWSCSGRPASLDPRLQLPVLDPGRRQRGLHHSVGPPGNVLGARLRDLGSDRGRFGHRGRWRGYRDARHQPRAAAETGRLRTTPTSCGPSASPTESPVTFASTQRLHPARGTPRATGRCTGRAATPASGRCLRLRRRTRLAQVHRKRTGTSYKAWMERGPSTSILRVHLRAAPR